jgi:hypothetical protein
MPIKKERLKDLIAVADGFALQLRAGQEAAESLATLHPDLADEFLSLAASLTPEQSAWTFLAVEKAILEKMWNKNERSRAYAAARRTGREAPANPGTASIPRVLAVQRAALLASDHPDYAEYRAASDSGSYSDDELYEMFGGSDPVPIDD